jgi:hypothetical protein
MRPSRPEAFRSVDSGTGDHIELVNAHAPKPRIGMSGSGMVTLKLGRVRVARATATTKTSPIVTAAVARGATVSKVTQASERTATAVWKRLLRAEPITTAAVISAHP